MPALATWLLANVINTDKTRLLEKIDCLPDHLLRQVLDSDLSNLGAHEPYEWAEGELEQGKPIKYIPGKGFVIEE